MYFHSSLLSHFSSPSCEHHLPRLSEEEETRRAYLSVRISPLTLASPMATVTTAAPAATIFRSQSHSSVVYFLFFIFWLRLHVEDELISLCFSPNIVFDQIFVVYTLFLKRLRRWKQGSFVDFSAELWKGHPLIHPKKRGRWFCLILFSFLIMECCLNLCSHL